MGKSGKIHVEGISKKKTNKKAKNVSVKSAYDGDITLDLVKELGGDEDDLALLSGVEIKPSKETEEDFSKEKEDELKAFVKSLGFGKVKQEAFVVSDKDYPEDTSDEDESDGNEDKNP